MFRPFADHTLYDEDNRALGSTFQFAARAIHSVSCTRLPEGPALIEFEHPFALVGHVHEQTDYDDFRRELPDRLGEFCRRFDPRIHYVLGSSKGAVAELHRLLKRTGNHLPDTSVDFAYWAIRPQRKVMPAPTDGLRVFHYGRSYPGYKGTRDVLDLARRFPSVSFSISIDTSLPIVASYADLPNVRFLPFQSKMAYDRALRRSHILLTPVYGDAWGVVLEAGSLAMPIISYDTFDKSETVLDEETGFLVPCPRELSLWDGFFQPGFRNFKEFEERVLRSDNRPQVDRLAVALERYVRDKELLMEHSASVGRFFPYRFSVEARLAKIRKIYRRILGGSDPS